MIAFLLGPFGKYIAWLIGALTVIAIATIVWFSVVDNIQKAATLKFAVEQQQQIIKAQQDLAVKTEELTKTGNDLADWAEKLNQTAEDQSKQTQDWINAQKDTVPFDPLFNQTIQRLKIQNNK